MKSVPREQRKSAVIILNGPSSAGKSSIAKEMQQQLQACYLHFQMDAFWDMVPSDTEANSQNFPNMKLAIIDSAKALLQHGHNLIIDIVCMPEQMKVLQDSLKEFDLYIVAVTADPEVLNDRERARGDRKIGLSASQHPVIHKDIQYDCKINTSDLEATEAAAKIIRQYALHPHRSFSRKKGFSK